MSWSRRVKHSSDLHGSLKLDTWSGKSWILCYKILFLKAGLCLRWVPWTLLFRVVVSSLLYPHIFSIHKLNINQCLKRPLEVAVSNLIWKSEWKKITRPRWLVPRVIFVYWDLDLYSGNVEREVGRTGYIER